VTLLGWIDVWRMFNLCLAVIGCVLTVIDVQRRSAWTVHGRFYWQAMMLLLVSVIFGSVRAVVKHVPPSPVQLVFTTLAVLYFVISIARADHNRKE
jgi:uncharacterized membrane protein YfcA